MNELHTSTAAAEDEIDLRELINVLWAGRLLIILCTIAVAVASLLYALFATEIYRAQASVQIRDENAASLSSQMGSLAALAGISVSTQDQKRDFALTALKSRAVIQRMIEEEHLLPILYANSWDAASKRWTIAKPPTSWKAFELFIEKVLRVSVDKTSGIVTIAIEWKDPTLAAKWVKTLIARVNSFVNAATVREAEQNLTFLNRQAQATNMVELQKAIFSMMESEIKRLMVARNPETAPLRVIDPAVVPEERIRPKRILIAILGILAGALLGGVIVLAQFAMKD
ncbi:MAG: hypothetical protein NAOJABEB_00114 [Steroidobacteraceae bacterium]|nr:hypothetical protein [Steroidobacteraceae bacterium]